MPRHHVPKLLYFASTSEPSTITVREALAKTIVAMPIISGSVAPAKYDCQKGSLSVQGPYYTAKDILQINDISNDFNYEDIRAKNFPTDAVPADLIAPPHSKRPLGVMVAQANFLKGGLLLYFAVHHCGMDEVGMFAMMKVWSAYCQGEDGLLLVKPDWFDRRPFPQDAGLGSPQYHSEYTHFLPEKATSQGEKNCTGHYFPQSSSVASSIFFFSDSSLARLKNAACQPSNPKKDNAPLADSVISTNDALCALLWTSITRARLALNHVPTTTIPARFCMTVNGRSRLCPPLSPAYTGNVVLISSASTTLPTLVSQPLVITAGLIRSSIAASTTPTSAPSSA